MRCRWTSRLLRIFFGRAVDVAYEAFHVPVTNATPAGLKQFPWRWTLDSVPGCIRPASSNRSPRRRGCRSRQDHNLGNCPCRNRASAPDPRLTQISFRKRASPSQGGGIDDKRMQLREAFVRRVFCTAIAPYWYSGLAPVPDRAARTLLVLAGTLLLYIMLRYTYGTLAIPQYCGTSS